MQPNGFFSLKNPFIQTGEASIPKSYIWSVVGKEKKKSGTEMR